MILRTLISIFAATLLVGCATSVPKTMSIESGVFTAPPPDATRSSIAGAARSSLAVILNTNTKQNTDYLVSRAKVSEGRAWAMSQDQMSAEEQAADPRFSIKWISASLKKQFRTVRLISSLSDFDPATDDYLAVVDTFYTPIDWNWGSADVVAKFEVGFYDKSLAKVFIAKGADSENINTYSSVQKMRYRQHQVRVRALTQLDQDMAAHMSR